VRYKLGSYISENGIPYSQCRESIKSYIIVTSFSNDETARMVAVDPEEGHSQPLAADVVR
jgi:hypothetical protein